MGDNSFAPGLKLHTAFIVRNITPIDKKVIRIFNNPILYQETRDLLQIRGVSESDIRSSLLKGEILNKFLVKDIELVFSNIDLLQFSDGQRAFLAGLGFTTGIQVGYDELDGYVQSLLGQGGGGGITPAEHETLRQLIHFIDNGPGDGFASGAVRITSPSGSPFPTEICWYLDSSLTTKLVDKLIVYNNYQVPTTITWNMYDFNGITIVHTVIDSFTYVNNVFEASRTRAIS
jgi:hypothetical protein